MIHFKQLTIKRIIVAAIFTASCCNMTHAQSDTAASRSQFLYPAFSKCIVKMKTGQTITADMNYNTVSQRMTFMQNGQMMDLNKPETVDTIIMNNRKFVYYNKVFLEILTLSKVSLFMQHKSELRSMGRQGAYGTTSQTLPPTSVTTLYSENKSYDLKIPENYRVAPSPIFWVEVNGRMHKILSEKQFLKLFPGDSEKIEQYIDKNNIHINDRNGLMLLIDFCNNEK